MRAKRILCLTVALLLFATVASADWTYNAFTGKFDYYEPVSGSTLGTLSDITFTGLARGDIIYRGATAWLNLASGAVGEVLTMGANDPAWVAPGAPGAHAASHEVGGADLVDHDQLTNYLAAQHLTLPNTIAAVLTDHNVAAHNALNITQLGTVTVGVWNGTDIGVADGGTGLGAWVTGDIVYASGAGTLAGLADVAVNQVLASGGVGVAPAYTASPTLTGLTTTGTLDPGTLVTPWTDVFIVAVAGGDYTTIQAALTAQAAGGELFLVAPGTYTNDTINFTANGQCVRGLGNYSQTHVTAADAAIVNFGAFTNTRIENMRISMTAPTTAKDMITGTGSLYIDQAILEVTNAAVVTADQPTVIDTTGIVHVHRGEITYTNSADDTDGATAIKAAIRIGGSADVCLRRVIITVVGSNQSLAIVPVYGLAGLVTIYRCDIDVDDDASTNTVGFLYSNVAGGAHEFRGNDLHVDNTTNIAVGVWLISTENVRSMFNHIGVTSAGGTANSFNIAAGATVISQLDDIVAANGHTGGGTLTIVSSEADGNLSISGQVGVNSEGVTGEIGVDFNSINSTFSTIAQSDAEGIAGDSDLRIGLDESLRNLIISDRGDIGDDFGLAAQPHPTFYIFDNAGSQYAKINENSIWLTSGNVVFQYDWSNMILESSKPHLYNIMSDIPAGNIFTFKSNANVEITDDNAEQAWTYFEPKVLQTGTAAFDGLYLNVDTANLSYGDGSTGDGNNLFRLAIGGTSRFKTDIYGYTKAGLSSGALADDATYSTTIPDSWTGIVIIQNVTDTTSGVYHLDGTAIAVINQNAGFTTTQGTNDKINVYIAGNVLTVENTWAAAKTVKVMFIGT